MTDRGMKGIYRGLGRQGNGGRPTGDGCRA